MSQQVSDAVKDQKNIEIQQCMSGRMSDDAGNTVDLIQKYSNACLGDSPIWLGEEMSGRMSEAVKDPRCLKSTTTCACLFPLKIFN